MAASGASATQSQVKESPYHVAVCLGVAAHLPGMDIFTTFHVAGQPPRPYRLLLEAEP